MDSLLLIAQAATQVQYPYVEWAKALAPIVAAFITVFGVGVTVFFTFRKGRIDAKFAYAGEALKIRLRQVEEFYGPMLLRLEQSRILYEKLKWKIGALENKSPGSTGISLDGFRLLDHIHRISSDASLSDLKVTVASILEAGEAMSKLIEDHSGLIEGGITDTFIQYRAHFDLLKAAESQAPPENAKDGWHEFGYYPRVLNREIREGYKQVLRHFEMFQDAADTTIWKLLDQASQPQRESFRKLRKNLSFYERKANDYARKWDSFDLDLPRTQFLAAMNVKAGISPTILDAGCGTGRDTAKFIEEGATVQAFDVSPAMLRECARKIRNLRESDNSESAKNAAGMSRCFELTFDELEFRNEFDGVWASASLLHVPKERFQETLRLLIQALKPQGVLFMSFKYGRGESEFDSRHYSYYHRREVLSALHELNSATVMEMWLSDERANKLNSVKTVIANVESLCGGDPKYWLNVIVRKTLR